MADFPPVASLRSFEAVARLGSVTQAAHEMSVTHSAVSQHIKQLEALVGVTLFIRHGRGVRITEEGRLYALQIREALQHIADATRMVQIKPRTLEVTLATLPSFGCHWLLPRLGAFHRAHPEVDLWLFTSDEEPDMAEQTIDLALRWELAPQAECRHQLLLADRLLPVAAPAVLELPAAERTTLHGERELDWHHWTLKGGEDLHLQTRGLNFSDPGLLLDAACQGLGIALVSERLSRPARQQGLLLSLSTHRVKGPQWHLLVHQESETMPECRAFCRWLELQFADPAPAEDGLPSL